MADVARALAEEPGIEPVMFNPLRFGGNAIRSAVAAALALPGRAMQAAGDLQRQGDVYDPAPAVDAAMMTMGGTAFGAPRGAMGAGPTRPVRPSPDDPYQALDAAFKYGAYGGNRTMPINRLTGGVANQAIEQARVDALRKAIAGPEGYTSRLLVDDAGNIIEGQHRFEALRGMGETKVPVTVLKDLSRGYNVQAMEDAVRKLGAHPDQVKGIVQRALEVSAEAGSPAKALGNYELPGWQSHFDAALKAAQ